MATEWQQRWQQNKERERAREIYSIVFISFSFKYMAVVIMASVFSLYEEVKEKADKNIDEQYKKWRCRQQQP